MDDPSIPPTIFPPILPPPNIEPRARAQTPELDELDMSFREFYDEFPLNGPIPQAHLDSPECQDAFKKLEDHVSNRLPYILLASCRLHEATGVQNQLPFDIPETQFGSLPGNAAFYTQSFAADGRGHGSTFVGSFAGPSEGGLRLSAEDEHGASAYGQTQGNSLLTDFDGGYYANTFTDGFDPLTAGHGRGTPVVGQSLVASQFMTAENDNTLDNDNSIGYDNSFSAVGYGPSIEQGSPGRQGGPSVSVPLSYPLTTPSAWTNPLLSHGVNSRNGAGLRAFLTKIGQEMDQYKLDCKSISFHDLTPDFRTNQHNNVLLKHIAAQGVRERITFYEVDLPIDIPIENGITRSTERWIHFEIQRPIVGHLPNSAYSRDPTPPNFPKEMGYSWAVFAAPLSNVTDYGIAIENVIHKEELCQQYHYSQDLPPGTKRISKRRDFDFSHAGIPIFEFSNITHANPMLPSLQFLSVDGMPTFDSIPSDGYLPWSDETYAIIRRRFAREVLGSEDGPSRHDGDFGAETPCPYQGQWWELFYTRMYEEARCWSSIKGSMGRGKCHVVLRWDEHEMDEENFEVEMTGMARMQDDENVRGREKRGLPSMGTGTSADGSGSGSGQLSSIGAIAGAGRGDGMSLAPMAQGYRPHVNPTIAAIRGLRAKQERSRKGKGKEIMKR